jgi:hypothetical protein
MGFSCLYTGDLIVSQCLVGFIGKSVTLRTVGLSIRRAGRTGSST